MKEILGYGVTALYFGLVLSILLGIPASIGVIISRYWSDGWRKIIKELGIYLLTIILFSIVSGLLIELLIGAEPGMGDGGRAQGWTIIVHGIFIAYYFVQLLKGRDASFPWEYLIGLLKGKKRSAPAGKGKGRAKKK